MPSLHPVAFTPMSPERKRQVVVVLLAIATALLTVAAWSALWTLPGGQVVNEFGWGLAGQAFLAGGLLVDRL